ncbi:nucleoside-diphosphate sugar epimerase [Pilimelia terevasa]|uniref:Nucleoside-diphosphate sugar epimerase n=1 Tax=Pilimelia terevasa TaxID=53372 RepID=A0A8J3BI31_9ACTN|nr:NAD-dependent epimerase/dehydratase family protein [Pilimelia terevasa]GGK16284.1 nucleoside-diphosphate sugar epimerase [Pilimelia terevasa]
MLDDPTRSAAPILVAGGCGFIGSVVTRSLSHLGRTVRVLDDLSTGSAHSVAGLPNVRLIRGSVLDRTAVAAAADGVGAVLNFAGVVGMRLAASQAAHAYAVATTGTANLLAAGGDAPVALCSSSAVYGLSDGSVSLHERLVIPRSVPRAYDGSDDGYATGKWEMEQLGLRASDDRPVLIVRPFNVVGPGQTARYGMVVPSFVRHALAGEALPVFGDGTQRRCFSEVNEFVHLFLRLLRNPAAWSPGMNIINVGSTTETSINQLAAATLAATGSVAGVVYQPYGQIFPGRRDVMARLPVVDRMCELAGRPDWPGLGSVIDQLIGKRAGRAVA